MHGSAPPGGNTLTNNIVLSGNSHLDQRLICVNFPWNKSVAHFDHNCYFNSALNFTSPLLQGLTPLV